MLEFGTRVKFVGRALRKPDLFGIAGKLLQRQNSNRPNLRRQGSGPLGAVSKAEHQRAGNQDGAATAIKASRCPAPSRHGEAATLDQAVEFYNLRFQMNLTDEEEQDLVNFLKAL